MKYNPYRKEFIRSGIELILYCSRQKGGEIMKKFPEKIYLKSEREKSETYYVPYEKIDDTFADKELVGVYELTEVKKVSKTLKLI